MVRRRPTSHHPSLHRGRKATISRDQRCRRRPTLDVDGRERRRGRGRRNSKRRLTHQLPDLAPCGLLLGLNTQGKAEKAGLQRVARVPAGRMTRSTRSTFRNLPDGRKLNLTTTGHLFVPDERQCLIKDQRRERKVARAAARALEPTAIPPKKRVMCRMPPPRAGERHPRLANGESGGVAPRRDGNSVLQSAILGATLHSAKLSL
mmetsp:Transcript_38439/g.102292  ORF Transcript_38439/g.102292 Transcript_38439/m.102292 type:complete len:205 (-) Transcript_38439:99-713(-)